MRRNRPLARLARFFGAAAPRDDAAGRTDVARIVASGLFDRDFYLSQIVDPEFTSGKGGERSEASLAGHYLKKGAALWLNPSRSFDTGFYLDTHPELARSGENPLLHYLAVGQAAGAATTPGAADWGSLTLPSALMAPDPGRPRKIFIVPATFAARNTTRYRVRHLVELLGDPAPVLVDLANPPDDFFAEVGAGAAVILQRVPLTPDTSVFLHRVRAAARTLAYDIDDQIFDANELEDWRIRSLEVSPSAYALAMALADQFLVSTAGLRDKIERRFRKPAHILTNCLGAETVARSLGDAGQPDEDRPFIIGYASGSRTHEADLAVALPAIERFLAANPRAEFHCIGRMDAPAALQAQFGGRVRYRKAVPAPELPRQLARFSVQIVPLADCPFNACKSHIRQLEAAAVGVPSIVSAVGEPASSVFHGVTGLVCRNDTSAWVASLQALHDDRALRERLGAAARRLVLANFTTASPFMKARVRRTFADLELGFLRDKLSIVATGAAAPTIAAALPAVTALPSEILSLGAQVAAEGVGALAFDAPEGVDPAATRGFLAGLAGERIIAFLADDVPPRLWDARLVQAAKAAGRPAVLCAPGDDDGPAERLMVAAAATFRRIAAAAAAEDPTAPPGVLVAARRLGIAVEALRGLSVRSPGWATAGAGRRLAIKVCTPIAADENVWGDTHFARGLRTALAARGYEVRIDKREEWHDAGITADIALHLHGIAPYTPVPGMTNILWIISHPEAIDPELLRAYDIVFCASDIIAERVRGLAPGREVATLHQCTDPSVFAPDERVARDIDIAFVGNSRRVYRDAVRFAVEEGFDVAIWGTRWEEFVDRRYIRGSSLGTHEVADVYRRSKVVLNDHWQDQRRDGLVNNRVFDVLACDTMVLSDANPGLAELLGGAVPTFADRAGFVDALRGLLGDPGRAAKAAALGAEVRRAHTFAERAATIDAAIGRLRARA